MKKVIFALIGALAMASIPLNVNAADDCVIRINSGETKTINYNTNNCRVENRGTLNVVNGANISKYTQDNYAAIDNYGTLNVSGGTIYADYGYAIMNYAGNVNISGGTIHSILHQAVWGKAGTNTKITGGTLKGAIGGEETVYTNGSLTVCGGNFNSTNHSNKTTEAETANCPKPAAEEEKYTITVTASIKDAPKNQKNKNTKTAAKSTTKSTAQTTAPAKTAVQVAVESKQEEKKAETKAKTKKTDEKKADETEDTETSKHEDDNSNLFIFAIAATITVLGTASAAIVINRVRR